MSGKKTYVGRIYLGDGKYQWVGRYPTKRERDKAVYEARKALEEPDPLSMTITAYSERFLAAYGRKNKASSLEATKQRLNPFVTEYGERALREFTRIEAQDYAAAYPSRVLAISTMFNAAIDSELLERNPFRGLVPQSRGRADSPPPTPEQFDHLFDSCSVLGDYAPRMRAFLRFTAFTLMRPSEVFGLDWADIDFETNRIDCQRRFYHGSFDTPKTGEKYIALPAPARDALLTVPREHEHVFASWIGNRLSHKTVGRYWGDVTEKAGLEFELYHATKHYGVWFLWTKLNLSKRAIAAQAGWRESTVDKMLRIYGHAEVGALEEIDRADFSNVTKLRVVGE